MGLVRVLLGAGNWRNIIAKKFIMSRRAAVSRGKARSALDFRKLKESGETNMMGRSLAGNWAVLQTAFMNT